ncbi:MAG: ribosome maturation factor RimM [bacterium]|nr:ribosome maturation factor RimM [bacterium]
MQKVYVGKVVGTHGIKGEIRIISDFQFKDKVFVVGNSLVINDKDYVIRSYRKHKNFDMVTLNDYNDINEVLFLVRNKVYFDKEKLNLSNEEVLDEDLLEFKVIDKDGRVGKVVEVFLASPTNKIIRVMFDKEYLIPVYSPMLKSVDKSNKCIYVEILD